MPKQLSLSERIVIERMLGQDYTFASIGRRLEHSASTVAREVKNYRCFIHPFSYQGNDCINFHQCIRNTICDKAPVHGCFGARCKYCPEHILCIDICPGYVSSHGSLHDKPPYTCNCRSTEEQKKCKKTHAYYTAHRANTAHHKSVKTAHSGIRKDPKELEKIGKLIKPLILKGQSLNHICTTHADEIGVSERTLYKYIDQGVFDVRNIDLPKKVVYKKRKERKVLTRMEYRYRQGRTIEDFKSYIEENPKLPVVEMDTVKGRREKGKVMLTMIFRESSFMLIFLMPDGKQPSVLSIFDYLTDLLGLESFSKLFPVILRQWCRI